MIRSRPFVIQPALMREPDTSVGRVSRSAVATLPYPGARRAFWLAQLGGWAAYGLSHFLTILPSLAEGEVLAFFASKVGRATLGMMASFSLLFLYRALRARRVALPLLIGIAAAACALLGVAWFILYRGLVVPALLDSTATIRWATLPRDALDLVFVLVAWSAIYFGALQWQASQEEARRAREAEFRAREAMFLAGDAQFRMLSYQLNPHFLFNALNAMREMISEDRVRAQDMVTRLAELLRYTLACDPAKPVTVSEEAAVIASYLAIEAIRFEDRLDGAVFVEPAAADCLIPRFLLHPLVENAVKYGSRVPNGPLRIRINAQHVGDRLHIEVRNSGRLRSLVRHPLGDEEARADGAGIGLANIRARLELVYPGRHTFDVFAQEGEVAAVIDLPAQRWRHEEARGA